MAKKKKSAPRPAPRAPGQPGTTPLPKMAQDVVDLSRGAYAAQPWLIKAQTEFGPKQAAAEALTAGARKGAETAQVTAQYPAYYKALIESSPEYGQAAAGFRQRMASSDRLYGQLEAQAADELALGGQLTGDEQREASQAARAAWNDRGLATSGRSAVDEVLARVGMSNARKAERRAFAAQTAAQGTALATQNMSVAASQFDPYMRLFGEGGSQVSGTLGTDDLFTPYATPAVDIYQSDKSYAASMAGLASAEKMQKMGFKHDTAMTKLNAKYSADIAAGNNAAARSAANSSILGAGIGAVGMLGAAGIIF